MNNKFDELNDWIRDTENSIVNFLSAFSPWLAPLIPAYMTFQHAMGTLEFPFFFAFAGSAVVEILGFSAVSTYLSFWFYNRRNKAEGKKAPLTVVVVAFGFYLGLIIFSNVLLDTFPDEKWAEITVRGLFTLQTIPAAMLVSVRTQHRELLAEIAKEKRESSKKVTSNLPESVESPEKVSSNLPTDWRKIRPSLSQEQVSFIANNEPKDIVKALAQSGFAITPRTASNWRVYAATELGITLKEN